MRINWVVAQAFGPLTDARLELKPGLNVVTGPNESAKSTWQAAIYAALCGRKRGAGASEKDDQRFRDRHKPWHGAAWQVAAEITLADGARIELQRELLNNIACTAKDVDLSRDVSNDIIFEGSPDASVWLGLNRRIFIATASVSQTQLLGVLDSADALQDQLQRVADTAGAADATAAAALALIGGFRAERVGTERRGAVKPLRRAQEARQRAAAGLEHAKALHAEYLQLVDESDELAIAAAESAADALTAASRVQQLADAQRLAAAAEEARLRAERAREVAAGNATATAALAGRIERMRALTTAIDAGGSVVGLTTDSLGDPLIEELAAAWEQSHRRLSGVQSDPPVLPGGSPQLEAALPIGPAQLRSVAAQLDQFVGTRPDDAEPAAELAAARAALAERRSVVAAAEARSAAVQQEAAALEAAGAGRAASSVAHVRLRRRRLPLLIAAGVMLAGGVGLALVGDRVVGLVLAGLGVLVGVVGFRGPARAGVGQAAATATRGSDVTDRVRAAFEGLQAARAVENEAAGLLAEADGRHRAASQELVTWLARRDELFGWCGARVLPTDATELRRLAADVELHQQRLTALTSWQEELGRLSAAFDAQSEQLAAALGAKGYQPAAEPAGLRSAVQAYRADCEANRNARTRNETELSTLSGGADLEVLSAQLAQFRRQQPDLDRAAEETATELRARTAARDAALIAGGFAAGAGEPVPDLAAALAEASASDRRARELAAETAAAANSASGAVRERAGSLPGVPEAEEVLAHAEAELARVLRLRDTLELTAGFLTSAQQHLYRDVAPILMRTIEPWLPSITGGRYVRASVNPSDLRVEVASEHGAFRSAGQLSVGTQEQIYLLLRVALAAHLTRPGESAPLLLDDVTVHADDARKLGLLDLVHRLSADRQIVLFAQERFVTEWARGNLVPDRDSLIELQPGPVG